MTIASLYQDIMFWGAFLLIGILIRELVKPLQKLFLPASLIGGIVALICGQQVLGLVEVPSSFSSLSGTLINVIMAALTFGVVLNKERIVGYLDYICVCGGLYFSQMALGVFLGMVLSNIWPGMPEGWGSMGLFSFHGGHGTASAAAASFAEYGEMYADNLTVGMILSTFGLVVAMTIGMVIVNYGIRKGWSAYVKDALKQPKWFYGGPLPAEQRKPIGHTVTTSSSVNPIALQIAWLMLAALLGKFLVKTVLCSIWSGFSVIPTLTEGIFGAAILYPVMCKLGLDKFVDLDTVNQVGGCCLEVVVLTAMATLNLSFVATNILPLVIYTVICVVVTGIIAIGCCRLFCKEEWFEKAMMIFGMGTGTTATGLALVRSMDPDGHSHAGDAHGIFSAVFGWSNIFCGLVPMWLVAGQAGIPMALGAGCAVAMLGAGFLLFGRKK